jgi:hypothetical protein
VHGVPLRHVMQQYSPGCPFHDDVQKQSNRAQGAW